MTTTSTNSESTNEIELITHRIDIASKVNIHSCSVYEYLKDIDGSHEPPVEIVALIAKFLLSKNHTNEAVNPIIRSSIPWSCSTSNPIPTQHSQSSCCSENSLLNIRQFIIETLLLAVIGGTLYCGYALIIKGEFWGLVPAIFGAFISSYYPFHVYIYLRDLGRVIFTPIKNVNDRVLSLNSIFDIEPSIKFYIDGHHTKRTGSGRNRRTTTVVTFRKSEFLKLSNCETLIEPNIYNENEEYRSCCYHFEYEILLHFDDKVDREKYINLSTKFINDNVHDKSQSFITYIRYNMLGMNHWILGGDNHGYLMVFNCRPNCMINIIKIFMCLCTIFCVSWLYKIPFYFLMKKKKLTITKYLSVGQLQSQQV